MAGKLYNALSRQNNLEDLFGAGAAYYLGNKLQKLGEKLKSIKKYDPAMNLDLNVDIKGNEVNPDVQEKPVDLSKPTDQERPGAGSESGNGPGFIPRVNQPKIPVSKTKKEDPGKLFTGQNQSPANTNVNDQINSELQDYISTAMKFGSKGAPFVQGASSLANMYYQKPMDEGTIVNKNGIATRMIFDPGTGQTVFKTLKDASGGDLKYADLYPDKELDTEIKKKSLKPNYVPVRIPSVDGVQPDKLGFMSTDDFSVKPTETNWMDYNTNPLAYDKLEQEIEKINIKNESKSSGTGSHSGPKKKDDNTVQDGIPILMFNGKEVNPSNAVDFGLPVDIVKNYYSGDKKLMKKAKNQLTAYGNKITYSGPVKTPGNQTTTTTNDPVSDWKNLFKTQWERAKNKKDPLNPQAVQWLQKPENINYAKQLGLISE